MRGVRAGVVVKVRHRGGVGWMEFPALSPGGGLLHAISTREGGVSEAPFASLNLRYGVGDRPTRVAENRVLFAKAVGVDPKRLTTVNQTHGDVVVFAGAADAGRGALEDTPPLADADALVTNVPRVPLFIQTADCLPVILWDPVKRAVGLAHAGWRGAAASIAVKTLGKMVEGYGTDPREARCAFGPAIGACCYEVDDKVRKVFLDAFAWGANVFRPGFGGKWHLDLEEVVGRQLEEAGVPRENILRPGICTVDNVDLFYSHRLKAMGHAHTGRFATLAMIR